MDISAANGERFGGCRWLFLYRPEKERRGEWKFILDVGTDAGPRMNETGVVEIAREKSKGFEHKLREAEETFLQQYKRDKTKAYRRFASENIIQAGEKHQLRPGYADGHQAIVSQQGQIEFTFLGQGIAPSGDLGYAYGSAMLNGKKET
ncbi:MAG TPA: hypothetical protein VER36_07950 [Flavisolibacter sp.]|nr:hypothetical protein [Flavisolibacter sp.]